MNEKPAKNEINLLISFILKCGLASSLLCIAFGAILYFVHGDHELPNYHVFTGESPLLENFSLIIQGVFALDSFSFMQLGIYLLVLTPVARVMSCIALFALENDSLYICLGSFVLCVLFYSLFFQTYFT